VHTHTHTHTHTYRRASRRWKFRYKPGYILTSLAGSFANFPTRVSNLLMALCGVSVAAVSSPPSDRSSVSAVDASSPPPRLLVHHPSHLFSIRLPRSRACYQNFYIRFNDLPSLPPSLSLSLSLSLILSLCVCLSLSLQTCSSTHILRSRLFHPSKLRYSKAGGVQSARNGTWRS